MINIQLEKFEGPLSLLIKLIDKEEMDITQVSMAKIADQYVNYIRTRGNINSEEMADFLVVAARLLLIKSKALLPYIFPEEEEEADDLERQLKMYKEFLEAAKNLEKMIGKKKFMFVREFDRRSVMAANGFFSPPKKLTKEEIKDVFGEILSRIKPPEKLEEKTLERKITIEEKIIFIQQMVLERLKVSFNKILSQACDKTEIIVSFLAVLEMMRQREIVLDQEELFSEIFISRIG
jgi:segregation and condensation protein A